MFSPSSSIRNGSAFCKLIQSSSEGKRGCYRSFYDNSLRSAEYGNSYIFRCRFGIISWVTPVLINGEFLGSFTELLDTKIRQEKYIQQARISEEIQMMKRKELELLEKEEEEENSFIYVSSIYPLETERELLRRVRLGDKEGAREVLS
jgi:two-component system response regulator YesN